MKQFNLEEYLKNPKRKVVTRDGRDVRVICTDRKTKAMFPTNPRTEQASLSIDRGLYEFYKDYFDKIITFEKEDR